MCRTLATRPAANVGAVSLADFEPEKGVPRKGHPQYARVLVAPSKYPREADRARERPPERVDKVTCSVNALTIVTTIAAFLGVDRTSCSLLPG